MNIDQIPKLTKFFQKYIQNECTPFYIVGHPLEISAMGSPLIEFMVEYRAYLGQIPACNGYINEFNLSCKSVTNNSSDMSRI